MARKAKAEEHGLPSLALVFGYIAIKDLQKLDDRVTVLSRLGYGNAEIAKICETTPATVGTLKSKHKRSRGRKKQ